MSMLAKTRPVKRMKKYQSNFKTTTSSIDSQTGEVVAEDTKVTSTSSYVEVASEPDFIKVYCKDILYLSNLDHKLSDVLFALFPRVGYDGRIAVNKKIREEIALAINKSESTVATYIEKLCKKGVIIREARGSYIANPSLFGKGTWKQIQEIFTQQKTSLENISLTIEYSKSKKKISSSLSKLKEKHES